MKSGELFASLAGLGYVLIGETNGDVTPEAGKWAGPIFASALSLAATFFAYLSGRDKLIYDYERRAVENENTHLKADIIKAHAALAAEQIDHKATRVERDDLMKRVNELIDRLNEEDETRRRKTPRGPKKPGTDLAKPLPPATEEPES